MTHSKIRNYFLVFITFIFYSSVFSQGILKGRVISSATQKPLAAVSVYLNNTSIGTITDDQGYFIITGIPIQKYTLVVSCIGYETHVEFINTKEVNGKFVISLKETSENLAGVVVYPSDPDGWEKWGKFFRDLFIGRNSNSDNCSLENPSVLKFRLNKENILIVSAVEPIIIRNETLGYEISYKLEEFEYNYNAGFLRYNGYAFFTDLSYKNQKKASQYKKERQRVYLGSLLHFMRSIYSNRAEKEGFEIKNLGKIYNPEKEKAKRYLSLAAISQPRTEGQDVNAEDSTKYYKKLLNKPDSIISNEIIHTDSLGFERDKTAGFYFPDSLEISYHINRTNDHRKSRAKQISQIVFINKTPVYILANGYYYNTNDLKLTGYWAFEGTMSSLLPYNYSFTK